MDPDVLSGQNAPNIAQALMQNQQGQAPDPFGDQSASFNIAMHTPSAYDPPQMQSQNMNMSGGGDQQYPQMPPGAQGAPLSGIGINPLVPQGNPQNGSPYWGSTTRY